MTEARGLPDRRADASPDRRADDPPPNDACDRCETALDGDRWIRVSTRPCDGLTGRYDGVTRAFCPNCVAAVGLLEHAEDDASGRRSRDGHACDRSTSIPRSVR